jgi:predicted Ser/Thr protein kinase
MRDDAERELRIAVAEGVLAHDEVAAIAAEAERAQCSPLSLLVQRGQLTDDSVASLRVLVRADASPPPPALAGAPAFPIAGWDRYTAVRFLGQGGMGQVFLARDHHLRRDVAIKFMRGGGRADVHRLIHEARAQARVDHERVCKVHEVGEIDGQVYIAMQYLAGRPLGELAGALSVADKVAVIRDAALGLHAAHRAGVIHRDVKPSNILVERGDDGALRAYVVDFGLARTGADSAATADAIVGTPRYMAPEQSTGRPGAVDHRADVYSLGATLYHLLTGAPPVPGTTLSEVAAQRAIDAPVPPRALAPAIPLDLEAIVLTCLARDRDARYASARALAADLARFLAGEPVGARHAGAWYRAGKRIARQPRVAAALAIAALGVIAAASWAIVDHRAGEARARAVRQITERVEAIEAAARFSALSPPHDLGADRAAIRDQLAALAREVATAGADVAGAGASALGRGYLALADDARARHYLEAAWQHGFHEPRTAFALATALDHQYRQRLRAAERLATADLRDSAAHDLARTYRDPALTYLAASRGALDVPGDYLAARAAAATGDLDAALDRLAAIDRGRPWFFEAEELRGDVLLARALRRRDLGDDTRARADLAAGRAAYAAAGAIAHSRPAVFVSLAELEDAALRLELYGHGDVAPAVARVIAATGQALALVADDPAALTLEAAAYRSLAEDHTNHGRDADADAALAHALADAQRAVAAAPEQPEPRLELSRIYRQTGEARESRNQDPSAPLRQAAEVAEGIRAGDRDAAYFGNLGLIFGILADYQDDAGADARADRDRSLAAYRRAVAIDDRLASAWINLGVGLVTRAAAPHATDADGDLRAALAAFDRAVERDARNVVIFFYRGEAHKQLADRALARGDDPDPQLGFALDEYQRGRALNPQLPHFENGIGAVHFTRARLAWQRGDDPEPALTAARAAFAHAIQIAPEQGYAYANVGDVLSLRAAIAHARGGDPRPSVREALAMIEQALHRIADNPVFLTDRAIALAIRADDDLAHDRDPERDLIAATTAIDRALARNPESATAHRTRGEVLGLIAARAARRGRFVADDFARAADAIDHARALAPDEPQAALALARLCQAWALAARAAHGDPAPALARGQAAIDRALALRPAWPYARRIRASFPTAR